MLSHDLLYYYYLFSDKPTRGNNIKCYVFYSDTICCGKMSYLAPIAISDHSIAVFSVSLNHSLGLTTLRLILDSRRPNFAQANSSEHCAYISTP